MRGSGMMNTKELIDSPEPKVAFVVVNWNQVYLTDECLISLSRQNYQNFAIILVDNGSEDGSVKYLRNKFPEVDIIENNRNMGVAAANNLGIFRALERGADYVFLLNNDTVVSPDMLSMLINLAESDTTIGITGPIMLYYDYPDVIWCSGSEINWKTGAPKLINNGQDIRSLNTECMDVDFISSCAVCIKRLVFDEIGFMDERYFIYYDEVDWFARATSAGWRSVVVPCAKMWHKVSFTMGESSPLTDYYMVRNNFLFLWKNLKGMMKLISLIRALLINIRSIFSFSIRPKHRNKQLHIWAKYFGIRDALMRHWGPVNESTLIYISTKKTVNSYAVEQEQAKLEAETLR
jgi:GT2 family glycosyltransferase